jgi:hypothetical protein
MGSMKNITSTNETEYITAIYVDHSGEEYDVLFTKTQDHYLNIEERELLKVEKDEEEISEDHPIWNKVKNHIHSVHWIGRPTKERSVLFFVEIDQDWLETLNELTELVLKQPASTPQEALEVMIFSQIQNQNGLVDLSSM